MNYKILLLLSLSGVLSFTLLVDHAKAADTGWLEGNDAQVLPFTGTVDFTYSQLSKTSDDTYAEAALPKVRSSKVLHVYDYQADIPKFSVIDKIECQVEAKRGSATIIRPGIQYLTDGINYWEWTYPEILLQWNTTDSTKVFGEAGDTFDEWSKRFSPDEVNAHDFGCGTSAYNASFTTSNTFYVDAIKMRITYHEIDPKIPQRLLAALIPTVYATTTCTYLDASTTQCATDPITIATTSAITIWDDPTRNIAIGLLLFFIMFFGLIFYFRK